MARIRIRELRPGQLITPRLQSQRPELMRARTRPNEPPDITLINLNLMLVNADGSFDQQAYLPLGLLYISGCLEREGYNVELVDYQLFSDAQKFDVDLFVEALDDLAPLVGIGCMSNLLPFSILAARRIKRAQPDCRIVLGGVGPSPVASELLRAFPFIDCVVEGEGELNMLDFMRGTLDALPQVRTVSDLDSLALPAYNLVDFSLYDSSPSIITSRGCPYKCTFCTEPYNFGASVRFRSVESIVEELELVHALSGRTLFLFQDDILPLQPSRFRGLLKGLRELSFPIQWKCFSRVDLISDELMMEMADTGCVQIRYGIESGSNRTLERIRKGFTIELAREVAARSVKYFPSVHVSFIWGYPFEEIEEFEETLHAIEWFQEAGVRVLLFEYSPLPGSPLFRESAKDSLRFSEEDYSFFVITGHELCGSDGYSSSEEHRRMYDLIRDFPQIFSGFYRYDTMDILEKRQRLRQFAIGHRSPLRNEYDL